MHVHIDHWGKCSRLSIRSASKQETQTESDVPRDANEATDCVDVMFCHEAILNRTASRPEVPDSDETVRT